MHGCRMAAAHAMTSDRQEPTEQRSDAAEALVFPSDVAQSQKLVYTAQSKQFFYCRDAVCEFVFDRGAIPLHPFRVFDYFLGERVPRDVIRRANQRLLSTCEEVWVFGDTIADGVLVEIAQATQLGMPIRFFTIDSRPSNIVEIEAKELGFESEVHAHVGLADADMRFSLSSGRVEELVDALGRSGEIQASTRRSRPLSV